MQGATMPLKFAINGFGRIGRCILRAALARDEALDIVAINDLDSPATMAHLFKYDSVHRTWPAEVTATEKGITVGGKTFTFTAEKDPAKLPWKAMGVDVVLECTGRFTDREEADKHLAAGAKKVLISAPAKGPDVTIAYGINHAPVRRREAPRPLERLLHHQLPRRRWPRCCSMASASTRG